MTFINPGVICEITRPKLSGVGEHAGVFLPDGRVVHHDQRGPRVDTFDAFTQGRAVKLVRRTDPSEHWQIMGHIQSMLTRPQVYRLFDYNCEHFVSEVLGKKKESRQINGLAIVSLLFIGIATLT